MKESKARPSWRAARIALLGLTLVWGCDSPTPRPNTDLDELPLSMSEQTRDAVSEPEDGEVRGPFGIVASWEIESRVHEISSRKPLGIRIKSYAEQPIEIQPRVEMIGLGRMRQQPLSGPVLLEPGAELRFEWLPSKSPLQPVGTSLELSVRVAFTMRSENEQQQAELVRGDISSQHAQLSYAAGYSRAFLSTDDDLGVRLASLATTDSAALVVETRSVPERLAAVLDARDASQGVVDGIDLAPAELARLPKEAEAHSDTLRLADDWDRALAEAESHRFPASGDPAARADWCTTEGGVYNWKQVCVDWRIPGMYNDSSVVSSVPLEDHLRSDVRARYVWANVYSGGASVYAAHLDGSGCTASHVRVCTNPSGAVMGTSVTLNSGTIYRASGGDGPSVAIGVVPFVNHVTTLYAESPSAAVFRVETQDRWSRAAAVASHALSRSDLGLAHTGYNISINVNRGWSGAPFTDPYGYTEPGELFYGEASADSTASADPLFGGGPTYHINIGRTTVNLGTDASPAYQALPQHNTQSKYTLGHELGHAAQRLNGGYPGSDGYAMRELSGPCSCEFVSVGNKKHCLASRHRYDTANVEGFGHYFAARIMNDTGTGADCRFTYYKTNLTNYSTLGYTTAAPPAPVNCSSPYTNSGTTSWMRYWCPSSSGTSVAGVRLSERDWLTFMWAVNGSASASEKSTLGDLMMMFAPPASGPFQWSVIHYRSLSLAAPKASKVYNEAYINGLW